MPFLPKCLVKAHAPEAINNFFGIVEWPLTFKDANDFVVKIKKAQMLRAYAKMLQMETTQ